MKKVFSKEVLIGALVIIALGLLFVGIDFLKGINVFKAANYFYATYDNVQGIAQSAPVTLNGYKIGLVREIHYNYDNPGHVTVEFSVDKNLRLPKGSKAVVTADLLGTASINLILGNSADGFYAVGDTVMSATDAGMLASVSENLMPAVSSIFPKIDTLITSLNRVAANPSLTKSIDRFDEITLELNSSIKSLRGVLAAMGPVASDVKSITANVDSITNDLAGVSRQLNQAHVDSIMNSLQTTVANLEVLSAQLNDPNSSIGKLTNDPALYDNINATVVSLDSLFTDIKKNPKRYINIKVF